MHLQSASTYRKVVAVARPLGVPCRRGDALGYAQLEAQIAQTVMVAGRSRGRIARDILVPPRVLYACRSVWSLLDREPGVGTGR